MGLGTDKSEPHPATVSIRYGFEKKIDLVARIALSHNTGRSWPCELAQDPTQTSTDLD
jgi:hypothetical protein